MFEKTCEKKTLIVQRRTMDVCGTEFIVPFGTTCYKGGLYYATDAAVREEAVAGFEKVCIKEGIFLSTGTDYDFRPFSSYFNGKELYVCGEFLFLADDEEEIEEKCRRNGITLGNMEDMKAGRVITETKEL